MNTTVKLNTGNFSIILSGAVSEKYLADCITKGVTYDMQRTPATKAYLAVSGIPGKKAGSLKFPEFGPDGKTTWSRDSVEYSAENAATMQKEVEAFFKDKLSELKVVVIQHVKEESADGRDTARGLVAKWTAEGKLERKLELLDYEGDANDSEAVLECVHAALVKKA